VSVRSLPSCDSQRPCTQYFADSTYKLSCLRTALSDKVGTVEFESAVWESVRVAGSLSASAPANDQRTTFDQFWRKHGAYVQPIGGLKIDVEGHENSVLRRTKVFLKNQRPKLVMFEYLDRTDILQARRRSTTWDTHCLNSRRLVRGPQRSSCSAPRLVCVSKKASGRFCGRARKLPESDRLNGQGSTPEIGFLSRNQQKQAPTAPHFPRQRAGVQFPS
jgi:FkbM family methyltransferase